eukprot:118487_1
MSLLALFSKLFIVTTALLLTYLFLVYYEVIDVHIDILETSTIPTNNRLQPINYHIKQFASDAAFCNLTSSFASNTENRIKEHIYKTILSNQFPTNCNSDHETYWINTMAWKSGLGWQLHQLALSLLTAVSQNKIFIWGNNYKHWPFIQSPYCKTMECYFEPITNCSLPTNKKISFSPLKSLQITLELQKFWNPILEIDNELTKPFLSLDSHEYTLLVTIAQWYLLRYNKRTQSIIAKNIEATLNLMHLKPDEIPNPNEMISIPVRHSDKCYNIFYNNAGAEMLCFEAEHIVTIAQQIQFIYEYNGDIKYGIVNSEDSNIVEQIKNSTDRSFHILTNVNDIRPETGNPKVWNKNENVMETDEIGNDYMTSMLTVAQLSTIPRYWLYMFSSNWFFYLAHFRTILKCWPDNMDKNGDIQIELESYCRRCPIHAAGHGTRTAIYKSIEKDVSFDEFLVNLLDLQCVNWTQTYNEEVDKYELNCLLTDKF